VQGRRITRVVASAAAITVALAACSPGNDSADPPTAEANVVPSTSADVPAAPDTVRGWVTFGHPVVSASVSIADPDGAPVGSATTDEFGYFESSVAYGPDYVVTATGGTFAGEQMPVTLRTVMNTDDPEAAANIGHIDVNMATTLIAEHLDRNPHLDEEDAEATVADALGRHPDTDLGALVASAPHLFSASTFAAEVPEGVTVPDHVDAVADGLADGRLDTQAFLAGNPVSNMALDIVSGFLKNQGVSLITKQLGLDKDGTAAELQAIRAQLDHLQVALVEISRQAQQLAADATFTAAVDATINVRGGVRTASRLYMDPLAERAIQVSVARDARKALPDDATDDTVAAADTAVTTAEDAYGRALANFTNNYNSLAGGAFVKLNMFLEPGTGGSKSIVAKYGDTLRTKRFVSKADSDAVFAVYEDFASWQGAAAYLEAEYQSAIDGNVAGAVQLYDEAVARQQGALPSRLTTPGIAVDVQNNMMWAGAGSGVLNWGNNRATPTGMPGGPGPYGGWRIPSPGELGNLFSARGGSSIRDYMVSISTDTGFDRNWWSQLNSPIWTSGSGTDGFPVTSSLWGPMSRMNFLTHQALKPNGSWQFMPSFSGDGPVMTFNAQALIDKRFAAANGHVLLSRPLGGAERYL
jgi:hypothetical protein